MANKNLGVRLVANTSQFKSEMSAISRQMRTVKGEMDQAKNATDQYGNRLQNNEGRIRALSRQMDLHRQKVRTLNRAYQDSARQTGQKSKQTQQLEARLSRARAEMTKTEGQLRRLQNETRRSGMSFQEFDQRFRSVGSTMQTVGGVMTGVGGIAFGALSAGIKDVVETTMDFEQGMSEVQAISGATGSELDALSDQAKEMGRTTRFSASEASDGMSYLARAGFEVNEIMDTMPGMLDLAAASNMDLGRTADITSNILSGFGMEAEEAGEVADVLAEGASSANTDVENLGNSMQTVAPVANTLGVEFESAAAATGKMADAGIDGSQAGRMLRQGMLRLSNPTGEASDLIEELGINVFDADGNMKSLDEVVAELEGGLAGMSGEAEAAALATLFGSESTAGWSALLETGSDTLADYTEQLQESEGAAADMADTMQDNLAGKVQEFQSALEGLKIEMGENLLPIFSDVVEAGTDFVSGLGEMDEATMKANGKTALLALGLAGVTTAVGTLALAIGGLMALTGPVGLAIVGATAGLSAIGLGLYHATQKAEENEKANLDNAESLNDQAIELENSADRFEELSEKAEISNRELGRLYDINEELKRANHPEEVEKLQQQYEELAKKSGLSKDELQELFTANDNLIEQTPGIETSITDQGNAWVDNTEAVREYIDTMYEASMVEIEAERIKAAEQEAELRREIADTQEDINYLVERQGTMADATNMSQEEIRDRLAEIEELQNDAVYGSEEWQRLTHEHADLTNVLNGDYLEGVELLQEQTAEKRESLEASEEELAKVEALDQGVADILLKRQGINETGHEGLVVLDETIAKNKEKIADLVSELETNGELTDEQEEQLVNLTQQNAELLDAQGYITNELELYGSVNSLVESQRDRLSEGTQERIKSLEQTHEIEVAEGNIVEQIQNKNSKLMEEREQLVKNREEQGANKTEIDKQIAAIDEKINTGEGVIVQMLKELDILELVREGIQLNGDQLVEHLEQLGYTTEEAYQLASELSGETVEALKEGTEEAGQAGKEKGEAHSNGLDSTKESNTSSARGIADSTNNELDQDYPQINRYGVNKGTEHSKGLSSTERLNLSTTKQLMDGVLLEASKGDSESQSYGRNKGDSHNTGLSSTVNANTSTARSLVDSVLAETNKGDSESRSAGTSKGTAHNTGLSGTQGRNRSTARTLSLDVTRQLRSTTDGGGGRNAGNQFSQGLRGQSNSARGSGRSVASNARGGLGSVSATGTGRNFISGFRSGMNNRSHSIWNTAYSIGRSALSALNSAIRTASPSRETMKTGGWFTEGFALGIDEEAKQAEKSATDMATGTHKAMTDEINQLARTFTGAAYTIRANKEVLKVEHEVNSNGIKGEIKDLSKTIDKLTALFDGVLNQQQQQIDSNNNQEISVIMDGQKVGKGVAGTVDKEQSNRVDLDNFMHGY